MAITFSGNQIQKDGATIIFPIDGAGKPAPMLSGFDSADNLRLVPVDASGNLMVSVAAGVDAVGSATLIAPVATGAVAVQILAADGARKGMALVNDTANEIFVGPANTVLTTTGVRVAGNSSFTLDLPGVFYTGPVWAISTLASSVRGITYA